MECRKLLAAGADVNARNDRQQTPLQHRDGHLVASTQQHSMSESKKSAKEAVKARRRQSIATNSMTGYMHKRAIKRGRNWKRRYFILSQDILSYYEDECKVLKLNPKGEIKLDALSTIEIDNSPKHVARQRRKSMDPVSDNDSAMVRTSTIGAVIDCVMLTVPGDAGVQAYNYNQRPDHSLQFLRRT
jgi:hypothetical protein